MNRLYSFSRTKSWYLLAFSSLTLSVVCSMLGCDGSRYSRLLMLRTTTPNLCYAFAQKRRLPAITTENRSCLTYRWQTTVSYRQHPFCCSITQEYYFFASRGLYLFGGHACGHTLQKYLFASTVIAGTSFPSVAIHFFVRKIGRYTLNSLQALGETMYYFHPKVSEEHK